MISNLVSNAVKFTADGVVSVTVTPSAEGLTFAVRDSGIGIPPSRLGTCSRSSARWTPPPIAGSAARAWVWPSAASSSN
uniref:histidine kinase n=1 Tax=Phenylobacterium glaciei TaxID=2803784 RepID=A0A974P513_9CAUL|nr:hypothetical protein JKL49_08750 [Phenylobacterium glaciei]